MSDKALILNEIQGHLGFSKDADFARHLGVTPQTLSNWKSRGTFDINIVYTKCLFINPHWLITGEGQMLKNQLKNEYTPPENPRIDFVSDTEINTTPTPKTVKLSPKTGEKLSPTLSPTDENCKICDQKERVIQALEEVIKTQKMTILALRETMDHLGGDTKKQAG
ncbi:MAG: helix-turn-helix domain-containing protein [Chitinophagaceae bacterium]|nr:helix-turn-helix domain-containing protein [Chitinophagaceae bacterium]